MERIASFCVDHTTLQRGMYLSRQDGDVLTWDIRMKRPNQGDYLSTGARPQQRVEQRGDLRGPHGLPDRLLPADPGPDPGPSAGACHRLLPLYGRL